MLQIAKHQFHDVYQFHTGKFKIFTWNSKKKRIHRPQNVSILSSYMGWCNKITLVSVKTNINIYFNLPPMNFNLPIAKYFQFPLISTNFDYIQYPNNPI